MTFQKLLRKERAFTGSCEVMQLKTVYDSRHSGTHFVLCISRKKASFLGPPHVRDFVKEGYFFEPRYEVWVQNPLTIHEIYAARTPSDSRSDWASEFAAATCGS